jgi:small-conductance mechanosensitive channel
VSLVVVLTIGAALLRANRVRSELVAAGERPEARATLAGLIHAAVTLTVAVSFGALLIGYISFARFLTYELVWFDIVLCSLYLLTQLTRDICEALFSAQHAAAASSSNCSAWAIAIWNRCPRCCPASAPACCCCWPCWRC